ncbi:MAG: glycosyl transferase [Stappia sp.]|uniref:glycosyltransferase family 4 protein n=1 Tax=Stappia sp. TaxID=1870903 RepID=UPI000C59C937|nr:glycosyltransferase family 4 protein [Stappia sp.]MAA98646.1 glycosyl transferase [Stappia sp.]MBM20525.1 glycosyl transferase [Stappia sp.]
MRIAFTAPMKPLDDPVPSGDRTMGRLLVRALELAGHEVRIATRFRSWSREGGVSRQNRIEADARAEARRIGDDWAREGYRPDVFLTYHLYHKAPDWIGPALADRFATAYAVVEASRAPKRRTGEWAHGFAAADMALARADRVAALHRADHECLADVVPQDRLQLLAPFLDAAPFLAMPHQRAAPRAPLRLLAVGMMREGAKLASYRVLAEALRGLAPATYHLTIAGDGPCRDDVASLMHGLPVILAGEVAASDMARLYAAHDLLVWPAVREAFGFVFLEAQAAGLGVVGGATFGVPDIVAEGKSALLSPEGDAPALAANLSRLLADPARVSTMGEAARAHIRERHTLGAGAARLDAFLHGALRHHASTARQ